MSDYITKYEFKETPNSISYSDDEPLKLTEEFIFYHNKLTIRNELTRLQNLFMNYFKKALIASGIRDSYLKKEITENNYFILFATADSIPKMNEILESNIRESPDPGCFYLKNTSEYMLVLAKDLEGIRLGTDIMEEILTQTLDDYFKQQKFDDYIKIRPFEIKS